MKFETIAWKDNKLRIIDQTKLPMKLEYIDCETVHDVWEAIKKLKVRGAPAIGVAGAFGAYLGVKNLDNKRSFKKEAEEILDYLFKCRPTAVNLEWALDEVRKTIDDNLKKGIDIKKIKENIFLKAIYILEDDKERCKKIGENGQELIKNNSIILTHCNAGALATAGYGTALSVLYCAKEKGKNFKVYADETRPLLQGSRLSAWELQENGIDVTVISDNMAGHVIRDKGVDCIIVGADRITSRGDVANKIGTYGLAVLAEKHNIPFYVAAPMSTFDFSISDGKDIPIEERDASEIINGFGKQTVPPGVKVYNPAFDVTPAELVTAIITEEGVRSSPKV